MAGRARGCRLLSFSMDSVAISRGDSLPPTVHLPTPVYPVMDHKPLPLAGGEEAEYLLALKQDFRGAMKSLPCFIQPVAAQKDVERYSDKYHTGDQTDDLKDWILDWKRFPKELRVHVKKPHRSAVTLSCPKNAPLGQKKKTVREKEEVLLTLEKLEKKEEQESSEEEVEEKKQDEEAEEEEEYDEEEFEEETDYIMSYFDNGEDFGGDSDDNMDEAIY